MTSGIAKMINYDRQVCNTLIKQIPNQKFLKVVFKQVKLEYCEIELLREQSWSTESAILEFFIIDHLQLEDYHSTRHKKKGQLPNRVYPLPDARINNTIDVNNAVNCKQNDRYTNQEKEQK
jgi:hypothetical protein